jgi:ATP-dependent Clp protease adaptor protein ClpS
MTIGTSGDTITKERVISKFKEPGMYKVVFLNDNVTPMDFVVQILVEIFHHSTEKADKIMKEIHNDGSGVAGVYTYEIAEQKGVETTVLARESGFPLGIKIEEE